AQLDSMRTELTASGKNKDAAPALAQAKRDFEAKFRVIYDQSHDLNSPLNAINGFSEILLDEKGNKTTPEERREFVAHINESAKRLGEHIRELIEFAKQEAGIQERPVQMVPPVGMGSKPPVILVADNDPAVKERIEPFLSHAGYEVVIAASAQEALRKAVQSQPLAGFEEEDGPYPPRPAGARRRWVRGRLQAARGPGRQPDPHPYLYGENHHQRGPRAPAGEHPDDHPEGRLRHGPLPGDDQQPSNQPRGVRTRARMTALDRQFVRLRFVALAIPF